MTAVVTLVVHERFVDIPHPPFACCWHEKIWYLVLLYLYTLTVENQYRFDKAVEIGSS
jgi:hypothetical protein